MNSGRWALLLLVALAGPARAQLCTASATGLVFGRFDPAAATPADITASVSVNCQAATPATVSYVVQITAGGSGSIAARRMAGVLGGRLNYQVYTTAARSTVWGDGTGGSATVGDGYALGALGSMTRSYTAYGRIPARQVVRPDMYSDLLTIIITY